MIRFWSVWFVTVTLNFQCQIFNFLYLWKKWNDSNKIKNKHVNWMLGCKCGQKILTLAISLTLNFQGQIFDVLCLRKNSLIVMKHKKRTYQLAISFDLGHDLHLFKGNLEVNYLTRFTWGKKWFDCDEIKKQNTLMNVRPEMWSSVLTLAIILTLKFQGQIFNLLYLRK